MMECIYPNYLIDTGRLTAEGKKDLKFVGGSFKFMQDYPTLSLDDPRVLRTPCGQCANCRLNRAQEWSVRVCAEALSYKYNYFLTLTYSDNFVPQFGSLKKADLQKFNKDLREYYRINYDHIGIRFYSSGEYGDTTFRPHYHGCYFNLPIEDLKFYKSSKLGFNYFNSDIINKIWGKGFVVIGEVTPESARYVARYVMKKQTGDKSSFYQDLNIEPEFSLMSNRPGIGKQFLIDNFQSIFEYDKIVLPARPGDKNTFKIPRYFKKLGETIDADVVQSSVERKAYYAELLHKLTLSKVDLSEDEYLFEVHETEKKRQKVLTKSMI